MTQSFTFTQPEYTGPRRKAAVFIKGDREWEFHQFFPIGTAAQHRKAGAAVRELQVRWGRDRVEAVGPFEDDGDY